MDRLTIILGSGVRIKGCRTYYPRKEEKTAYKQNAIVRLAAYEDTSLTPEEVSSFFTHARWKKDRDTIMCSNCGFGMFRNGYFFMNGQCFSANDGKYTPKYCPDCGAKMDGGRK